MSSTTIEGVGVFEPHHSLLKWIQLHRLYLLAHANQADLWVVVGDVEGEEDGLSRLAPRGAPAE
jgi:hypothetical protein